MKRFFPCGLLMMGAVTGLLVTLSTTSWAQQGSAGVSLGASSDGVSATASTSGKGEPKPTTGTASGKKRVDPANITGISPTMELIAQGNAAYVAQDLEGAKGAYQKAIKTKPDFALAHLQLGQVFANQQQYDNAMDAYKAAQRYGNKEPEIQAKSLFVQADLLERQQMWDESTAAWRSYIQFLTSRPKVKGFADNAKARIEAIEKRQDMAIKYAEVQKRIVQREQEITATKK